MKKLRVELIEQSFPADADKVLETLDHPIPVCADESCHTSADLVRLTNRYEMINVKLDKTGGLTEALRLSQQACENAFNLLIGCMVGTSLSIAPARLLASAYQSCLDLAEQHHIKSIVFPSLSTGAYGYPLREAAQIAVDAVRAHLARPTSVDLVRFVCFSDADLAVYRSLLED